MQELKDLLYKTRIEEIIGSTHLSIKNISFDSRTVNTETLFVAVKGEQTDGHQFISSAIEKGAVAVLCEALPDFLENNTTYIRVKNSSEALGIIASNFYQNPSEKLKLIGITGTNGKTTTATLLYHLFTELGYRCGLLSTVINKIADKEIKATHTTPDAITLNYLLNEMVLQNCTHCFMEVSSHAVVQSRISGLNYSGGIFTNITHDHLDYHKTFEDYIHAKKGFFDLLKENAFALVNKDDKNSMIMLQNTKAKKYTFSLKSMADFNAKIIENQFNGMLLNINGNEVWTKLIGGFNAYNLLGIYAAAILLNTEKLEALTAISKLDAVEGRFQHIKTDNGISAIVDYAHTPDALKNVLNTIKEIRTGNESVITIVGCGGNRDKEKRPLMAKIACELSNKVILTSDNPRKENPEDIINEMKKGVEPIHFKKTLSITDRREAIKTACLLALPGDIILVAGKGHEKYQEINGEKMPFDDLEILKNNLKIMEK
ncbi:MAG: UDP-N-acetylmuramoyl-L-alanyl-D-glutamate--2,6-diaminopimelate ligase [Bacteroidetes bacterium]|nr:UDP-N-acetylmuramoyl-L-alanyl-D-glutamate--2,6-diaminopimelate ligase [Bacteroidota bacterium]MBV6460318.1 UDP-N-acetylmuramoyl-L-alanyl-D-glutamate--2,6-diaminopimelate ligase [Flavobacteriales bacterium]WKZ74685.1 MAG: UDP-N-acetylmuramoyl-L-alanyl-D-glutamate--2,6-diaminopimelate ligase [Vicingaceae bacterium]MCL4815816.1 UDP-N-acetylmuramoyl-L-alanyl-D-glutamate--2,6-diaminopimelate ligase [Flavobacteriales bacterium]NOG94993.1 UDP-N-acetylmuramoyl-L-alanyl-D-glutamate--2,6-diaminopimela